MVSSDITYSLQGGRRIQSYRHSGGIKQDHVQSAGGEEYSTEINMYPLQTSNDITYSLQERREHSSHIHVLHTSKERARTSCRRVTINAAVRSTFCRHQTRDHVQAAGGAQCSSQISIMQTSNDITYSLQEGGQCSSQIDILEV